MVIETPGAPRAAATEHESWSDYLDPDETLLWQGAPSGRLRFTKGDVLLTLFGCVWTAFALFFTVISTLAAIAHASGWGNVKVSGNFPASIYIFPLMGLAFLVLGIVQTFGPVFWDAWKRRRTRYALTDRRALVACSLPWRMVESFPIGAESWLEFAPGREAMIYFSREKSFFRFNPRHVVKRGFELIPDGDEVYRTVRQIQRQDTERRSR